MDEKRFLEIIADALDTGAEDINMDTDFRKEIEYFDSLKGFLMITLVEDEFNVQVPVEDFLKFKVVGDMFKFVKQKSEGE